MSDLPHILFNVNKYKIIINIIKFQYFIILNI